MVAVTILGVVITGGGYGLAWADHETYVAGEPDDLTEKMTISAGGWAAVSGGYSTLGRDFTHPCLSWVARHSVTPCGCFLASAAALGP